jgi:uncharacterized membrane protein
VESKQVRASQKNKMQTILGVVEMDAVTDGIGEQVSSSWEVAALVGGFLLAVLLALNFMKRMLAWGGK